MALLDGWKANRALSRAQAQLGSGDTEAGWASADEAVKWRGADALVTLADRLALDGHRALAREALERALRLDAEGWNPNAALADLLAGGQPADRDESIRLYRKLNAQDPAHAGVAQALAALLLEAHPEDAAAALKPFAASNDLDLLKLLATAQYAAGHAADAVETLQPVMAHLDEVRRSIGPRLDQRWREEVEALYESALAETEGAEALVVDMAVRRNLDSNSGSNFHLLAAAQMAKSARIAPVLELRTPDDTEALGRSLLEKNPADPAGLCQLASAKLRRGELDEARKLFLQLQEQDRAHFGASRGIGAVLKHVNEALRRRAVRLPEAVAVPPGLVQVVPDWPALTPIERRVVLASVLPLAWALPVLAQHGMAIRLLPVDVRAVDLKEFEALAARRAGDDHRSYAGIGGLAGHKVACAQIEELLDVTPRGWVFAHEFSHLVHRILPEDVFARIVAIWDEAGSEELEHELDEYQHRNVYEFFAVAYQYYLSIRHFGDAGREILPGSPIERLFELIEEVAADEAAPERAVAPRDDDDDEDDELSA